MAIYTLMMPLSTLNLDMRPNATRSPSGSENTSVSTKISIDTSMPFASWDSIVDVAIYYLRLYGLLLGCFCSFETNALHETEIGVVLGYLGYRSVSSHLKKS